MPRMISLPPDVIEIKISLDVANQRTNMVCNRDINGFFLVNTLLALAAGTIGQMQRAALMEIGNNKYDLKAGEYKNESKENNDNDQTGN